MNDSRRTARLAGALWLVVIAAGVLSVATQSGMPRLAFAADLFSGVCYLGVTVLLYHLFNPVDTSISLFAAFCGLGGVASGAALPSFGPTRRRRGSMSQWSFSALRSSRSDI